MVYTVFLCRDKYCLLCMFCTRSVKLQHGADVNQQGKMDFQDPHLPAGNEYQSSWQNVSNFLFSIILFCSVRAWQLCHWFWLCRKFLSVRLSCQNFSRPLSPSVCSKGILAPFLLLSHRDRDIKTEWSSPLHSTSTLQLCIHSDPMEMQYFLLSACFHKALCPLLPTSGPESATSPSCH